MDYSIKKIRNVALASHGGCGKTTLAESMLLNMTEIERLGKVPDGNTVMDFSPEEIKRKISISTALSNGIWKDTKINIIDTPGFFDFEGDLACGLRAADCVIILVSGKSGVGVGSENAWDYAERKNMPKIIFINDIDDENSNYSNVLTQLKEVFGKTVAPFYVPLITNNSVTGYVDLIHNRARDFKSKENIKISDSMMDACLEIKEHMYEAIAETSEELMEKFFNGDEFTTDEILQAVRVGVEACSITPVMFGSSINNIGVTGLLNAIVDYFPSPDEACPEKGIHIDTNEEVDVKIEEVGQPKLFVFKTISDPFVGKLSIFKVISGKLTPDLTMQNINKDTSEKLGKLFVIKGKKQIEVKELVAGDIGCVAKLVVTKTGDTLALKNDKIKLKDIKLPIPNIKMAIVSKEKGDEEKISAGLSKLKEEDPTIKFYNDKETHQFILCGVGEQHLEVIASKLKSRFNVEFKLQEPIVAYREKIKRKVSVEGKHKKQSGGHGQFGHCWIEFEPHNEDELIFAERVVGGAVPKNYFPAVEKGLRDSIIHGVLAGYPVVGLKATLYDGSYHPVDSSEMAFKMAAHKAYIKGLEQAGAVILEPIGTLGVIIPNDYMGDVIGDINKRRGRVLGMTPINDKLQQVDAEVPVSEMAKYATDLRSMTQGRGKFEFAFVRYEEAPAMVAEKVISSSKFVRTIED
jgi:elongation factor G